jgi:hypothetical protein
MYGSWRIVGLLLLITTAAALPDMQMMPNTAAATSHPAGCHSHGPMSNEPVSNGPVIPSPAPVSYQCCESGHQAALPNLVFSLASNAALPGKLSSAVNLDSRVAPHAFSVGFIVPSDSPPITGSLRI